jgi:hypothetical protein
LAGESLIALAIEYGLSSSAVRVRAHREKWNLSEIKNGQAQNRSQLSAEVTEAGGIRGFINMSGSATLLSLID